MSTTPNPKSKARLAELRASFSAHADTGAITLLGQLTKRHSSSLDMVRNWFDTRRAAPTRS